MTAVATPIRPPRRYVAKCAGCGSTDRRRQNVDPPAGATGAGAEVMRVVTCAGCGATLHRFPARLRTPAPGSRTGADR